MADVSMSRLSRSERVRVVAAGTLAGMVAGLVGGIGARLAMRIVALDVGQSPAFTVTGSLAIIILGILLGIPIGLLFVAARRYLPGPRLIKGLVLGAILLLLFTYPIAASNEEIAISPRLGLALFSALFLVAGLVVALVEEPIKQHLPVPHRSPLSLAAYSVIVVLSIFGTLFFLIVVVAGILGINI